MSRGSTPRHGQTARDLGFAVRFIAFRAAPLSSGPIVPRVIPGKRSKCQTLYCQLFKAALAYTSTSTVPM